MADRRPDEPATGATVGGARATPTITETGRWRGVVALTFVAVGVGVVAGRPSVMLVGVLGFGYLLYARSMTAPDPVLEVERSIGDAEPEPGETVGVRLTVTNAGERPLPDLRVLDGVPEDLRVASGSPRRLATLGPGESTTATYTVTAARGVHRWGPVTALARDPSGATERRVAVDAGESRVTTIPPLERAVVPPVRRQTATRTGAWRSESTGHGIEFHSVREYQPGDALSRIDWRHLARTGDPATVSHHAEGMVAVVLLVDARRDAYKAPDPTAATALERAVAASRSMAAGLLDGGNRVGVAVLGDEFGWLGPGLGRDHRMRLRRFLALDPSLDPHPPAEPSLPSQLRQLWARLPGEAQVTYCAPLLDRFGGAFPRRLESRGHLVTVVSPDVTAGDTPGRALAAVERANRVDAVRRAGIPVVDWGPDEPLAAALQSAARRRSP